MLILAAQNQNKIKIWFDMGDKGMIYQNQLTLGSMASNLHIKQQAKQILCFEKI